MNKKFVVCAVLGAKAWSLYLVSDIPKKEAFMFQNDDCTGAFFKWEMDEDQDEVVADNLVLDDAGWHDRGESIKVPAGFSLKLIRHVDRYGLAYTFEGKEDEIGEMVC